MSDLDTIITSNVEHDLKRWPIIICVVLALCFLNWLLVTYVFGTVIATLAIVEQEEPFTKSDHAATHGTISRYTDDPAAQCSTTPLLKPRKDCDGSAPITGSLSRTLKHIRSHGGLFSWISGVQVAIIIQVLAGGIVHVFSEFCSENIFAMMGISAAVNVLLARLHLLWTHIIISEPSPKHFWRRFASKRVGRKIFLPTLAWSVSISALGLPLLFYLAEFVNPAIEQYFEKEPIDRQLDPTKFACAACSLGVVMLVTFMLTVPVHMLFVRCQAALLAEQETPIIPFDRTFGGRVVPESEGGSGKLSIKDAWKSFSRQDWRRVWLVYAKIAGLHVAFFFDVAIVTYVLCLSLPHA